jgi:glycerol-3-phosphate acyltransferase PlsX
MIIALDAMGGDFAPEVTVAGAIEAVSEYDIHVILVGDTDKINARLQDRRYPAEKISIFHSTQVAEMDDAPTTVLRKKKKTPPFAVPLNWLKTDRPMLA